MRIVEIIPHRHWQNVRTGATASVFGAVPWTSARERDEWTLISAGYTWRRSDGCVGLARKPAATRQEAEAVMARVNAR